MTDPLSILGGVAASIQLAECATAALLGTIKLIREIRDVPKKTARYLEDVERSSERLNYICRHIVGAEFTTTEHIDTELLDRLSSGCDNLRLAVDEAKGCLEPLAEATRRGKHAMGLRLWNGLVSTTRETAILEKLQRIDRKNLELIEELNIVSFVTQTRMGFVEIPKPPGLWLQSASHLTLSTGLR
ncbi:hypothetical protein CKAH01_02925 [Colletotrichum kahawae]|uniref:Fungal N-terminal domain-containing protein n=1 Tax=Colletotrichum kahawae TaxID=34407 RepID=A0AAD9YWG2_COLKA|nr:hypothetical protein CKAH01_02925 [Colletotrichum kahawae]